MDSISSFLVEEMGQTRRSVEPSEKSMGGFSYTHSLDLKDRILYLDVDYLQNEEGRFKIIEIVSFFIIV